MSSEVVKTKGRPKKVVADPVETGLADAVKAPTTRAKSTKAATKPAKSVAKPLPVKKPVAKIATSPATTEPASKTAARPASTIATAPANPGKSKILEQVNALPEKGTVASSSSATRIQKDVKDTEKKATPTASSSKILEKVKTLSTTKTPVAGTSTKAIKPLPTTTQSKATAKPVQPSSTPPPSTSTSNIPTPESKSPAPLPKPSASSTPPAPAAKPHIPLAELNSSIVSNISTRAGARPNTAGSQQLPKNYKSVSRKVTMGIVAMPIAIVTSYVLYQRLVMGEDRKLLVKPGLTAVADGEKKEVVPPAAATPSQ